MRKIISKFCDISEKSYYVWKNKSHIKLINLLEQYFSQKELEEFLETGKIYKQELIKEIDSKELEYLINNRGLINHIAKIEELIKSNLGEQN